MYSPTCSPPTTRRTQCFVYEHGWQSWSPAGRVRRPTGCSPRPRKHIWQAMAFRPERPAPDTGFQAEGLLAIVNADGSADVLVAGAPDVEVPSIRVRDEGGRLVASADGPVEHLRAASLDEGLAAVGDLLAARLVTRPVAGAAGGLVLLVHLLELGHRPGHRRQPRGHRRARPRHRGRAGRRRVPARHRRLARRPAGLRRPRRGRAAHHRHRAHARACGPRPSSSARTPTWLPRTRTGWSGGAVACERHWDQEIRVLDVTHPDAAEHLVGVFATLRDRGFRFHKIDFIYGGAMAGRRHEDVTPIEAYRRGLELVRAGRRRRRRDPRAAAPRCCPSIGLVDAMRISPDVMPAWDPDLDDISQPGMRSALAAGRARAWMHGRLWVNDPDCVLVRPEVERPGAVGRVRGDAAWPGGQQRPAAPPGCRAPRSARGTSWCPPTSAPVHWDPWAGPDQGLDPSRAHPSLDACPVAAHRLGSDFVDYRKCAAASLARIVRYTRHSRPNRMQSLSCYFAILSITGR